MVRYTVTSSSLLSICIVFGVVITLLEIVASNGCIECVPLV